MPKPQFMARLASNDLSRVTSGPGDSLRLEDSKTGQKTEQTMRWLWIVLAVTLCIKAYLQPITHTVYPVFEAGSQSWRANQNLYVRSVYEYEYSPPFAAAFVPFTYFATWSGGALWSLLNVALLYWSLRVLIRDVFPDSWSARQQSLFSILVVIGSARGFWSAQSNTLVFALVAGAASAIARRRWWAASFLLTIPIYIKVWPVAAALLLMACWPRQLIGRFVAAMATIAAFPFLTKPASIVVWQYQNYFQVLTGAMQLRERYRDLWMLWEILCPPVIPQAYVILQLGMAVAALAMCLWQLQHAPSRRHVLTSILGIWVSWQLTLGPGVERNTFCLVAPLIAWGLITSFCSGERLLSRCLIASAFAMTMLFSFGAVERLLEPVFPEVLAALPVGVVLFAAWLVLHVRSEARPVDALAVFSGESRLQHADASQVRPPALSTGRLTFALQKHGHALHA